MAGSSRLSAGSSLEAELGNWKANTRCSSVGVARFGHNLSILLSHGLPIVASLDSLANQEESSNLSAVMADLARSLESGHKLSDACRMFPGVFPPFWIAMVQVGESTGQLALTLESLARWMDEDIKTRQRVKTALTYPTLVAVVAVVLLLALMLVIMPEFLNIFATMHVPLPLLTRTMMLFTHLLGNPGAWLLSLAAAAAGAQWLRHRWSSQQGRTAIYGLLLEVPLLAPILRGAGLARMSLAAELSLSSGIDVGRSLQLALGASRDPLLEEDFPALQDSLSNGLSLSEHMRTRQDLYGSILPQLLAAGEESSSLSQMFGYASRIGASDVEDRVSRLTSMLEPILLLGVSMAVATILLSVFLPMQTYLSTMMA